MKLFFRALPALACSFFAISSLAQTAAIHPELSGWTSRGLNAPAADPFTADDLSQLRVIYTQILNEMVTQIENEVQMAKVSELEYMHGDLIAVKLIGIAQAIEVSPSIVSEDLWYSFTALKMRRITQQMSGESSAHYLTADVAAYKKLRLIMSELQSRGLLLPGVNIKKSVNMERFLTGDTLKKS